MVGGGDGTNEDESVEVAHGCEFSCHLSDWALLCSSLQDCDLGWDKVVKSCQ